MKYQEYFVQCMLEYICDKQGEVRQAASYGIGVMAQLCGDSYCSTLTGKTQFSTLYWGFLEIQNC